MGYLNPLLRLPAARAIAELPRAQRQLLVELLSQLRAQANEQAEVSWRRRKAPMAAYFRAVSTYARHCAHVLSRPHAGRVTHLYLVIEVEAPNPEAIAKIASAVLERAGLRVRQVPAEEFVPPDQVTTVGLGEPATENTVCYGAHLPTLVRQIEAGEFD